MKNIYSVGAPTIPKGVEDFNELAARFPKVKFYWFCYKLPLTIKNKYRNIHFITGLDDSRMFNKVKREMDVFISCSHFEGFCLPLAEAMILKKPVISYKLDEIESEFGGTIMYVIPFNLDEFTKKIKKTLDSHFDKKNLEQAKEYIRLRYLPSMVKSRFLKAIFI